MSVIDPNETFFNLTIVPCTVCGESEFALREGFYYCNECGNRQEQMRAVEVDREAEFGTDGKHVKKQKLKVVKTKKPELTSWECYNYILRGFVEDLLSLGAKEELKLTVLQIWAAYLRRSEVAFFSNKRSTLPRLGAHFHQQDARTLYNHKVAERAKRKRRYSTDKSSEMSTRSYRKKLRQLDESMYSSASQTSFGGNTSRTSISSSNATTNTLNAINLNFSSSARRQFKRKMLPTHLERHAADSETTMRCHRLPSNAKDLNQWNNKVEILNLKQLYAIIAIALNLVGDDMQLSDLIRFIAEERITPKRVEQYFPENIVPHCRRLLASINFDIHPDKYTEPFMRHHVGHLARYLHIQHFNVPDLRSLALRYITELNLPSGLSIFVQRLMNLLPPQMATRGMFVYAPFEARAMAYVIYILKLLFGLDGHRELAISRSAQEINDRLSECEDNENNRHPRLFVWSEWVRFIEMRKILVARHNIHFARQFRESTGVEPLIDEWQREMEHQRDERETAYNDGKETVGGRKDNRVTSMQHIITTLRQELHLLGVQEKKSDELKFPASYTPAHSYFRRLLLLQHIPPGEDADENSQMPTYMHVDHSLRTVQPFLDAQILRLHFAKRQVRLQVIPLSVTDQLSSDKSELKGDKVGIFHIPFKHVSPLSSRLRVCQADFDISTEEWREELAENREPLLDELKFKRNLEPYQRHHEHKMIGRDKWLQDETRRQASIIRKQSTVTENTKESKKNESINDLLSVHSFNIFDETNMDPAEDLDLSEARRLLQNSSILDTSLPKDPEQEENLPEQMRLIDSDCVTLHTTSMDCWMLLGSMVSLNEWHKKILATKLPYSLMWLLELCARTISTDWSVIYEQLLAIEIMFAYGVDNLKDYKDCLHYRYHHHLKDINALIKSYRQIW